MSSLGGNPDPRGAVNKDEDALLAGGVDGSAASTTLTIDEIFSNHIGEFGRHQIWLFSVVSLSWMPGAFVTLNMAFFGTHTFCWAHQDNDFKYIELATYATRSATRYVIELVIVGAVVHT